MDTMVRLNHYKIGKMPGCENKIKTHLRAVFQTGPRKLKIVRCQFQTDSSHLYLFHLLFLDDGTWCQ
jgi:hypothetical protein